jgi:hypothetical protein
MAFRFSPGLVAIIFVSVSAGCALCCFGQTLQQAPAPNTEQPGESARERLSNPPSAQQTPGSISGTVVDQSGATVAGAQVKITRSDPALSLEDVSGADGQFSFANVAPGPFQFTITASGFAPQESSGVLQPGEAYLVPQIALGVATAVTQVEVGLTRLEIAAAEIKVEEKQRVLGAIPNFYVSYVADAVPLTSKQKFNLAWKTVIDPFTFVVVGGAAGVEQAQNHYAGYGQGAEGYGKRFGAGYADTVAGTFIGAAVLPSLLKQDPRYFYKGTGSVESRFTYAIASSFICKGDNGHWQPNYSNVVGSLAAGGISNLYYPAQDRSGAGLTFENGAIGIGVTAAYNLFQEFFIRKLTPKIPHQGSSKP